MFRIIILTAMMSIGLTIDGWKKNTFRYDWITLS